MAPLYRLATCALLEVTPRKVVSVPFSHPTNLPSTSLSIEPFESPNFPEIFDIFDAPVKTREKKVFSEPSKTFNSLSTARVTSGEGRLDSKYIYNSALGLPWSLPPPVTFDGPACPPHMSPSALQKRRLQRQSIARSLRGDHGSPSAVSCSAFTSQTELLFQLFDGPSRVTRYQYPTSRNGWNPFTYVSVALCLSSVFGWLASKDRLGLFQQTNIRSP